MKTSTPGPWTVQASSNPKNGTDWRDIVSLGTEFSPSYVGEALEQDAQLIAAAPDLLAALEDLIWQHDNNNGQLCGMSLQDARAALKTAKGE